jgi:neuromedin U receptor 2
MMDFNISGVHGHHFNNMSTDMPEPPLYIIVIAAVMYGLTFLLGMLGNISIIIIVCKFTTMRSRMNYFLVNLSIADLFTLLVCIPSAAVDLMAKEAWYFGEAMCKYLVVYYK